MSISDYEKPNVTTDMVLFRVHDVENENTRRNSEKELQVLLVKRTYEPDGGLWSLPGGFVNIDEEILENVKRKLFNKTGIHGDFYIEQLYTWDAVDRDSRGRIISVSFMGLSNSETLVQEETENECIWVNVFDVFEGKYGKLAFDHKNMIIYALERLQNKIEYTDVVFNLLPKEFTIRECQDIYEIILGHAINNFRRSISDYIEPIGEERKVEGKQFRPAQLFVCKHTRTSKFQ